MRGDRKTYVEKLIRCWQRDKALYIRMWLLGECLLLVLNLICYRSLIWMLFLQAFLLPYFKIAVGYEQKKRRRLYQQGFKDMVASLMTSMQAGYSFQNACVCALKELRELYRGNSHPMIGQMERIVGGIELRIPTDQLFMRFAKETGVGDAYQLAVLLSISNKMGSNMVEILKNSMESMGEKAQMMEEIEVLLSGKIFEKNIMLLMPFGILIYLQLTNPGYIDCFYSSQMGHLLMTAILCVIVACFFWTERIMDFEV